VTRGSYLLVVSGLRAEARIAASAGVRALAGGGNATRLAAAINRGIGEGASGLLSFGMAGGLEPGLAPGTIVVPGVVIAGSERFATDPLWTRNLRANLPPAVEGALAGVSSPVATIVAKVGLRATTGAAAADMESHIAARAAQRFRLPLAVLRVIADPAERALPGAAITALGKDGRPDLWALLRSLLSDPAQLPGILGVAADARRAMAVLADCARLLGCGFGRPGAGVR
jgi:adenosylhomocysteine nucleosidase